jgi:hypothetical protein
MGKAEIRPFAETEPLNLQPPKLAGLVTLVTVTIMQTSIAVGSTRGPPRICEI